MNDTTQNPPADDASQGGQTAGAAQQTQGQGRIAADIVAKYPDLEPLIMATESMTEEEREYWFQILPIMTDEQIEKLRGILIHEKNQLAKLDQEYEQELGKLNDKHVMEWKAQEREEKRQKLQQEESAHEAEEQAQEADLLKQLEEINDAGDADTAA